MYKKEILSRSSWLGVGLILSLLIAQLIGGFEKILSENIYLAAFIPLVVYMSDAVGAQMEAIIIRELNTPGKFNFIKFLKKQAIIVTVVALTISSLAWLIINIIRDDSDLSIVIGLSLFGGIMTSLLAGALIPYLFWRLHKDPAQASGPVATVIQDFLSIMLFFLIAQFIYK